LLDRDPSINRSLLLRLIAGVRGLSWSPTAPDAATADRPSRSS
jgi:hypothetical protein